MESPEHAPLPEAGAVRPALARALRVGLVILTLATFLGPVAAGVWLALRGYHAEVGVGVVFAVIAPVAWSCVAFGPAAVLAAPVSGHRDGAHPAVVVLVALVAAGWQYCVIAAWTLAVFLFFRDRFGAAMPAPALAWI